MPIGSTTGSTKKRQHEDEEPSRSNDQFRRSVATHGRKKSDLPGVDWGMSPGMGLVND